MTDYSFETIGYYSVVNSELAEPVFKTINIEQVQRIHHDRIPLDCSKSVPIARNENTVEHLSEFLQNEHVLDNEPNPKEFNIISLASTLRLLLAFDVRHEDGINCRFYKYKPNTTVLEYVQSELEMNKTKRKTAKGEIAQILLTSLPDGESEQDFGSTSLFIVTKHKYVFPRGININLFVSKQIHSVIRRNEEIIPIDLKINAPWCVATPKMMEKLAWQALILSFLGGNISQFTAIEEDYQVDKVIVIEDKMLLCEAGILNAFKTLLPRFLLELTRHSAGTVTKKPQVRKFCNRFEQNIYMTGEDGRETYLSNAVSSLVGFLKLIHIIPTEHELVIIGSYKPPIPYPNQLFNADFVTLDKYCKGVYNGLLQEPSSIEFYGTVEEYIKLQGYLKNDQLAKLSFTEYEE